MDGELLDKYLKHCILLIRILCTLYDIQHFHVSDSHSISRVEVLMYLFTEL